MTVRELIQQLDRLPEQAKDRPVTKWSCDGNADDEIRFVHFTKGSGAYGGPGPIVRLT